jgi:flagellar motility protein MotE (MotC chaperone)
MNRPKGPRRAGRGVLYLLAGLLVASGLLRLGGEVGQVLANGGDPGAMEMSATPATCQSDSDTTAMLAAFQDREQRLSTREGQLTDRLQALQVAEAQITERLATLTAAEAALSATLATAATASDDDIGRLTAVYENMKPKDAAALFAEMAPEFAAGFLGRMHADAAAAVMSGLDPANAYVISVVLAGRNATVPRE